MSRRPRKPPRSRAETKQATRVALIAAGITEFAAHGFEVSLDAICARAKLTRGAFYVHFADRDAFIVAVMEHVLGTFVTALASGATVDPAAAIRLFLGAARAGSPLVGGTKGLRFHHVLEACRRSPAIAATYRGIVMAGRDRLARAVPDEGRADVLVLAVLGLLVAIEVELPLELDRLERALVALV